MQPNCHELYYSGVSGWFFLHFSFEPMGTFVFPLVAIACSSTQKYTYLHVMVIDLLNINGLSTDKDWNRNTTSSLTTWYHSLKNGQLKASYCLVIGTYTLSYMKCWHKPLH